MCDYTGLMGKRRAPPVRKRHARRDLSEPTGKAPGPGAFLDSLQSQGRYTFTRAEAARALGLSDAAIKNAFWRLARARRLATPRRGFYVIVPPEHRALGCLPAPWFIHDLMAYLGRPYYVGLLTAAALHGAAHQAPQEFQVVTDQPLPLVEIGRLRLRFVKKAHLADTPTQPVRTPTGDMRVSTPEATAFDLVRYPQHAGSLSNVATVLAELAERLDGVALVRVAEAEGEVAYAQRLGHLLELVRRPEPARSLAEWVAARATRIVPLTPGRPMTGAPRDSRWRLAVNDDVEPDEGVG